MVVTTSDQCDVFGEFQRDSWVLSWPVEPVLDFKLARGILGGVFLGSGVRASVFSCYKPHTLNPSY